MTVEGFNPNSQEEYPRSDAVLHALLTTEPLTLEMMTQDLIEGLFAYYIRGLKEGKTGDELLRSLAHERNAPILAENALTEILTKRIDANPENTYRRKAIRPHLEALMKRAIRNWRKSNAR